MLRFAVLHAFFVGPDHRLRETLAKDEKVLWEDRLARPLALTTGELEVLEHPRTMLREEALGMKLHALDGLVPVP
jgi:hypothetical protein